MYFQIYNSNLYSCEDFAWNWQKVNTSPVVADVECAFFGILTTNPFWFCIEVVLSWSFIIFQWLIFHFLLVVQCWGLLLVFLYSVLLRNVQPNVHIVLLLFWCFKNPVHESKWLWVTHASHKWWPPDVRHIRVTRGRCR